MTRLPHILPPLLALLGACGDPTALDLSLVPDPNVNSETALVEKLGALRVVIDSPAGLYPVSDSRREDDLEIKDIDSDGKAELVAEVDLSDLGRLPLVRVERGGLDEAPLEFRLDGLDKDKAAVAAGGVQGIRFDAGAVLPVKVPFNLRANYRPPRVSEVFPADGDPASGKLGSVLVIFSKVMNTDSLKRPAVFQVLTVEGGVETPVPAARIEPGELYKGGPTTAEYHFTGPPGHGTFRVRVSQGALDASGRPLDQVPMEPGNQPFRSSFAITAEAAAATNMCSPNCESLWCSSGGQICPSGLTCVGGACVPERCPTSCPPLSICDPALGACVSDCRVHGTYGGCADGERCDEASGLCVE
jgi:hypothetical protein